MNTAIKYLALLAGMATICFACNKQEEKSNNILEEGSYRLVFGLNSNGDETRSQIITTEGKKVIDWESSDYVGVYAIGKVNGGDNQTSWNKQASVDVTQDERKINVEVHYAYDAGAKIYCYAPYGDENGFKHSPEEVGLSIPSSQSQTATKFDASAMPMVSEEFVTTSAITEVKNDIYVGDINMINLGAVIDFKVFSSEPEYAGEKVESVMFTSTGIAGDFTFNLTGVDYAQQTGLGIPALSGNTVTTEFDTPATIGTVRAEGRDVYMVIKPGSYTGTVLVCTDVASYEYTISSAKEFKRSGIKVLGVDLATGANRTLLPKKITISNTDFAGGGYSASGTFTKTVGGVSYGFSYSAAYNNSGIQMKSGGFYNTTNLGRIQSITFNLDAGTTPSVFIGTSQQPSSAATLSNGKYVPNTENSCGYMKISSGSNYGKISNVVIKFYPLEAAGIAWKNGNNQEATSGSATIAFGTPNVISGAPSFFNPNGITSGITFNSTETGVATVSSTGAVTIVGAGETTLSATFAGNDTYGPSAVSYELTVSDVTLREIEKTYADNPAHGSFITKVDNETVTSAKVGDVVTIVHTPDANYAVGSVYAEDADNVEVVINENSEFTMPAKAVTILAEYVPTYLITATGYSHGSIQTNPSGRVKAGTHVTVSVNPDEGFGLKTLTVNGTDIKSAMAFDMPASDVTVAATFVASVSTPGSVTLSSISSTGFIATWGDVAHEIGYEWKLSTSSTAEGITAGNTKASGSVDISNPSADGASLSSTTWTLTKSGLTIPDGTYYFYVMAVGDDGYESSDYGVSGSKVLSSTQYFVKVESEPSNWVGTYLIVYETGNYALTGSGTSAADIKAPTTNISISQKKIEATKAMKDISISIETNSNSGYLLKTKSGYYIYNTSSTSNGLSANVNSSTADDYTVTLAIDNSGNATITSAGSYLRYNTSSSIFSYYKATTYTNQAAIQLYKLED